MHSWALKKNVFCDSTQRSKMLEHMLHGIRVKVSSEVRTICRL